MMTVARIVFDSGSQKTYISQRLKDSLQLPTVSQETLTIRPFGTDTGYVQRCDVTQLCIRSPYNELNNYVTAHVVPTVCAPVRNQPVQFAAHRYPHLAGLMLADYPQEDNEGLQIDILIGLDYYWSFLTGGTIRGEFGGPIALESKLGWILSGQVESPPATTVAMNVTDSHVLNIGFCEEANLETKLSRFWDLESIGITKKEESIYEDFTNEIEFKEGRYEVRLPWKLNHPTLPDNYKASERRLQSLFSRLKNDSELLKDYDNVIKNQEEAGIIERVEPAEDSPVGKTHYLAHHPVIRKDKTTTKVRVVFDASASSANGTSLNHCVYPGPCLLKTVTEILARFRLYPVALVSDIEKAFLMISIHKEDRNSLRFLWYENVNADSPIMTTYRFCRVVFGVSCSPYLLNATLKHHIQKFAQTDPEVCNKLLHSLYCDDVNTGTYDAKEAIELYEKSREIMKAGGFNLRKFNSNSEEVMTRVRKDESVVGSQNKATSEGTSHENQVCNEIKNVESKVLGLKWDTISDTFKFNMSEIAKEAKDLKSTKRNVLRTIAKIFDPLGVITPITTQLKVFLQELFKLKLSWDENLPEPQEKKWKSMMNDLEKAEEVSVRRYYFENMKDKPDKIELYGFCDSSEKAFAALVYAKVTIKGESYVHLVTSKTRVAPLSKQTIPRLELLACLILARLINAVKDMFSPLVPVKVVQCWTDSITALYWIKGYDKEWKIFIENRVLEIRKLTEPDLWSHCPGAENPADIPTREISMSQFTNKVHWWSGPEWLGNERESWPIQPSQGEPSAECLVEQKANKACEKVTLLTHSTPEINLNEVIQIERFNNLPKLLRTISYVVRFINNCRQRENKNKDELSAEELKHAEMLLIRNEQKNIKKSRLEELKKQLGTFTDTEGIIRCKGRLSKSSLEYETKNPILLPRDTHFTRLIILHSHKEVLHNGTKETLAEIRSRFWIVKGRQMVKKTIRPCVTCRRIQGQSYGEPVKGQLPEFRTHEGHAFQSVGIDFAGPLYVKTSSNPMKKVYIALFTCSTSRALHLELVPNLTTETFMLCLRRFVGRRGVPSLIITDNAKTFKSAAKILVRIFKSPNVSTYLAKQGIKWKYNLAKAPFWGGFYERLVRSVKTALKKCIGKARLNYDELNTVLVQIEAVLNSRPLTYLYSDSIEETLTPSHLVTGRRILNLPDESIDDDEDFNVSASNVRKRQNYQTRLMEHYWKRWKTEYLVDLREYQDLRKKNQNMPKIQENDVVTIEDENQRNRLAWKLGRITGVIEDSEGVIRGAKILLANGNIIERPVQKLFPLELSEINEDNESKIVREKLIVEPGERRPTREAATLARVKIVDQLQNQ